MPRAISTILVATAMLIAGHAYPANYNAAAGKPT